VGASSRLADLFPEPSHNCGTLLACEGQYA
jgi:hypothetical protein